MSYKSTLYMTERLEDKPKITLLALRNKVYNYIKSNIKAENVVPKESYLSFEWRGTQICFTINWHPAVKRYILSFYPYGGTSELKSYQTKQLMNTCIAFIDLNIGEQLEIPDLFTFKKNDLNDQFNIDSWKIILREDTDSSLNLGTFLEKETKRSTLRNFFDGKKNSITKRIFIVDVDNKYQKSIFGNPISKVKNFLEQYTKNDIEIIKDLHLLKEMVEQREDIRNGLIIFIGNSSNVDKIYNDYKLYLSVKDIPSQFVLLENVDKVATLIKNNFLLEILCKTSTDNIELQPIFSDIDGYLCLSDIPSSKGKLFGISMVMKSHSGYEDMLEIFPDLKFEVKEKYNRIEFDEDNIKKLISKVNLLVDSKGKKINIFLTRNWNWENIKKLVELAKSNDITVNKIFYLSSKTNKFVTTFFSEENLLTHPYTIIDDRIAFFHTNTKVTTFGTIFPIFVELKYYSSDQLNANDLLNLLWSIKKRLYRVDNFFALKEPEPLMIFQSTKKLYLGKITSPLRIKVSHLI